MKPKILVVDDNNDILDLFEIMLYKDFDVVLAVNGFEGLKKAENEDPIVIVTDIMMPVMDGLRLLNQLRKDDRWSSVPVIAVTTFVRTYTQKSLMSAGFDHVIPKPFEKEQVVPVIARFAKSGRRKR